VTLVPQFHALTDERLDALNVRRQRRRRPSNHQDTDQNPPPKTAPFSKNPHAAPSYHRNGEILGCSVGELRRDLLTGFRPLQAGWSPGAGTLESAAMARVKQEPLSRERFENNADRLIFPDRHEYRTRSRVEHIVYGILFFGTLVAMIGLPAWVIFVGASWGGPRYAGQIRMVGYVVGALFLLIAPIFVWFVFRMLFFYPRLIISPAGLDFLDWMPINFRFRLENFRVEFDDITKIEIYTKGEAGLHGNPASTFFHGVQVYADGHYELRLPWRAYKKDEAERFMAAFIDSIQELANRNLPAPFR
jgi:hypothetical protein